MSALRITAFALYSIAFLPGLLFGCRYLVTDRIMPYHQVALGRTWEELDPRLQAVLLGFMKIMGGGMIACSLGGYLLLALPFRAGLPWANDALLGVALGGSLPPIYSAFFLHARTGAGETRGPSIGVAAIGVLAFALASLT